MVEPALDIGEVEFLISNRPSAGSIFIALRLYARLEALFLLSSKYSSIVVTAR